MIDILWNKIDVFILIAITWGGLVINNKCERYEKISAVLRVAGILGNIILL